MSGLARVAARLVRFTHVVDRAYQRFDQMRSLIVLACASPSFHDAYTRLSYGATAAYHAGARDFRSGLFAWEERAIRDHFPRPPARILIGGAGGGREAFPLIERGYQVVAFEPVGELAASMASQAAALGTPGIDVYRAGYEDLPVVSALDTDARIDLGAQVRFEAAILGWSSFSHLSTDGARVETLRQVSRLTDGPILVSYFLRRDGGTSTGSRWLAGLRQRAARRGAATFAVAMGYTRLLTEGEVRRMVEEAGLRIVAIDRDSSWPNAVVRKN